ncbi:MAG: 16S rRNA (cytosine(967)-C(5))-methyltransferase RsmB [Lysobacterales bacterium]
MSGDARAQAARVLNAVIGGREPLDLVLPVADARLSDPRDRALLRAIVRAALRHRFRYIATLATLLNKPLPREQGLVYELLIVGIAQLDQGITPAYAAVNSTVAAARILKRAQFAGLVNAVLRRVPEALAEVARRRDPQILFEHPRWLLKLLQRDWPEDWPSIVAANNEIAPTWLRVHTPRARREQVQGWLAAHDFVTAAPPLPGDALVLAESAPITNLPGFAEGAFAVQDGAAQWAVEILDLKAGQRVLDACAAPGGKTAHIAARAPDIELLALEANSARIPRLNANLARMGVVCNVLCADATAPETWWDGRPFDRILIDAPCSGTGVIRRHPDIRWLRRPQDVIAAIELQARLLDALWPLLAPGGRLVYATCSVLNDENAHQLAAFLARTPQAIARDAVPHVFGIASGVGRQNLPGQAGMDGFFYAVVERAGA